MDNLYEIPRLPPEVVEAAEDGRLVIFIGAGASRLMGCPSWDGLADGVLRTIAVAEIISYGDLDSLKNLDARKKLSVATNIAEQARFTIDYKKLLGHDESKSSIYRHLNGIGCPVVTTNYDLLAAPLVTRDKEGSSTPVRPLRYCHPHAFLSGRLAHPETVIHLHGCLEDPASMVVTTKDYLSHYDNDFVKVFLAELFKSHTVLFVGYGLEEAEILEYVLRRGNVQGDVQYEKQRKRFLLQGYYTGQSTLIRLMKDYYKDSFGVHLCAFSMDRMDYFQLEKVIEEWSPKIDFKNRPITDEAAFIREIARGTDS